ncbi:hypothetical protein ASPZODRAFT_23043 [Penicilliopsis zonata CBS 506.65]|uniref:Uncharacterized protein n=1 Tax=Penicilliopsis zonata CBS 506.65 TaxID=1073090 RepID=A0A1L9ST69_9EURO|nr:hypothetical protein ASPZODRAFT_23043 [Penicilliopsis zonata CBS 506.65]OJJ50399.1 hypothetical protein ASPZODRAFT_23043 [Penicilliopsis zonata CBS 506.65]
MRFQSDLSAALLLAAVSAVQVNAGSVKSNEPCAEMSEMYVKATKANTTASIPARLGYECLKSMPFVSDLAVEFIEEYRKYLLFQSTIEILQDPPVGYLMPSTDLLGGLDTIQENAAANKYESQFDFDMDLSSLIASAHDGHLSIDLCSLQLLYFTIDLPLASVSSDGLELPQVYLWQDMVLANDGDQSVSPVASINGVDVVEFLAEITSAENFQDPDAQYNMAFPGNGRRVTLGAVTDAWQLPSVWPGESTYTIKFENGSTVDVDRTITTEKDLSDAMWQNGTALFKAVCLPETTTSTSSSSSSDSASTTSDSSSTAQVSGYPTDVVISESNNYISGYYLDGKGFEDIAVLVVPTFSVSGDEPAAFARVAREFIGNATADGKTKMLIDLSGNPGGDIDAGFNLFRLFFPNEALYTATRFRSHESLYLMGKVLSTVDVSTISADYFEVTVEGPLDSRTQVTPDQEGSFSSWAEIYGPHVILNTNTSTLYANSNFTLISSADEPISGYGDIPLDPTTSPFTAENIVLISDGFCSSTCTSFSELMKYQGVRSIAFGGRPLNEPMQAMGGVKGAESLDLSAIEMYSALVASIAMNASETSSPLLTESELDLLNATGPIPLEDFPLTFSGGELNFRNSYHKDNDQVPLQFVYEAAECRLFYTAENYLEQETVWTAAATAMWNGGSCVPGSTNGTGSLYETTASNRMKQLAILVALGKELQ